MPSRPKNIHTTILVGLLVIGLNLTGNYMSATFVVYIDESGDEGFSFNRGSSEWFVLSALIVPKTKDTNLPKLVDKVRTKLGKLGRKPFHFRDLTKTECNVLLTAIASEELNAISVLMHKPSISNAETFQERYILYFYMVRYLLERVSWFCRDSYRKDCSFGDGSAEVIFSNRSGMSYEEMKDYLQLLKRKSQVRIDWSVINPNLIRAISHGKLVGLQLADAVATSFFNAARYSTSTNGDYHANLLKPIVYKVNGRYLGYGVKFFPKEVATLPNYEWILCSYK